MKKCSRCGKHGLFLKLDWRGFCPKCVEEVNAIIEINRQKEQEKARKEFESIPRFEIRRDGQKIKVQPVTFIHELKYTGVTTRSNPEAYKRFVVLDVETTGLSITRNEVIEIAAARVDNWKITGIFSTLVKPTKGITEEAKEINGISEEMVKDAPLLYEIMPDLQEFISGYNLLGHNLEFDLKFLCRAGLDVISEKRKFFDSMKIGQSVLKKPKPKWDSETESYEMNYDGDWDVYDHKLETLCEHYHIDRSEAHRALGDCIDTIEVFKNLLAEKIEIEL